MFTKDLSLSDRMYMSTGCNIGPMKGDLKKRRWREFLRLSVLNGMDYLQVNIDDFSEVFPHVFVLLASQFGAGANEVSRYFRTFDLRKPPEGTVPLWSHTGLVYVQTPSEASINQLAEREVCATKIADRDNGYVWGMGGIYLDMPLDTKYFERSFNEPWVLVHGISDEGLIAIEDVPLEEVRKVKASMERLHQREDNQYVRNYLALEDVIKDQLRPGYRSPLGRALEELSRR